MGKNVEFFMKKIVWKYPFVLFIVSRITSLILLQQYNGLKNILQPYGYDVIQNSQTGPLPWFQNAIGKKHA